MPRGFATVRFAGGLATVRFAERATYARVPGMGIPGAGAAIRSAARPAEVAEIAQLREIGARWWRCAERVPSGALTGSTG
ncbi:hypothetical protein [Plantactinospora sp. WMMB782]|uniref:hypothetical protein n=1 Tax=Plantactinospora sp. WMMB782 TaxID=3404121 RepID=UPI003B95A0E7